MDKPQSMSYKEWFVKQTSQKLIVPEKIVNLVIAHQFDSANEALKTEKSVEIDGFGKFMFNEKKARKQLEKYYVQKKFIEENINSEDEGKQMSGHYQMAILLPRIKDLEDKLNKES